MGRIGQVRDRSRDLVSAPNAETSAFARDLPATYGPGTVLVVLYRALSRLNIVRLPTNLDIASRIGKSRCLLSRFSWLWSCYISTNSPSWPERGDLAAIVYSSLLSSTQRYKKWLI
jgi:hypothetical protein